MASGKVTEVDSWTGSEKQVRVQRFGVFPIVGKVTDIMSYGSGLVLLPPIRPGRTPWKACAAVNR